MATLGIAGVGLCLLSMAVGAATADSLSRVLTGAAAFGGVGAFAFLNAVDPDGGDPASFGSGSTFDSGSGGGDGGDSGDGGGGDGGGE